MTTVSQPMRTIALISCGKSKLSHRAPARHLYTGSLFRNSLDYARRINADAIFILSAKYGLLELEQAIDPYEKTLKSMSSLDVVRWGEQVLSQLRVRADLATDRFVILAGKAYRSPLAYRLNHVEAPLEGLRFGEQLRFLKSATA